MALLLLASCVVVAVSVIPPLVGSPPVLPLDRLAVLARDLRWEDDIVVVAGGVIAGLGLLLLLCALLPGKPAVLPLANPADGGRRTGWPVTAGVRRRSVCHALRRGAEAVDGVSAAGVRLRRHTVVATVRTRRHDATGLDAAVREAIGRGLDEVGLARRPLPRVRILRRRADR
ncbi:hypothetical protein JOF53_001417 [Crossiella equi]|uniref:DUF6286 domain-containing protein n=1 Tax=Crossiella equi TaxID=130796 RepID=A0ABS5A7H6_9PSEU|nr:DUF6286 domain-containing protein [Crossiella equi]MBP2472545.1 hypothetical protein [Crossiella equi]